MHKTHVRSLKLKSIQHERIDELFNQLTTLWNAGLEERIEAYKRTGSSPNANAQSRSLTLIRKDDIDFSKFHRDTQQSVIKRLSKTFESFFDRVEAGKKPGFPRFKSTHRGVRSFEISEPTIHKRGKRHAIRVKGIGELRFEGLPADKIKLARVVKTALRTSIHLVVEPPDHIVQDSKPQLPVGLDVGVKNRLMLSTGESVPGARRNHKEIKRRQRALSRAKKGSNKRAEKRRLLAKAHERVKIKERNALHRLTTSLVRRHKFIAVEKIGFEKMVKASSRSLSKAIHEQQWGALVNQLTYKAEWAGGEVKPVNPAGTSMTCSNCGSKKPMPTRVRTYVCGECDLVLDRDLNAARNILRRADFIGCPPAGWEIESASTRPGASENVLDPDRPDEVRLRPVESADAFGQDAEQFAKVIGA